MAIDFSWLITALQNIAANIGAFFEGIWGQVQNIVNTGQGIFSGLVNFGGWLYQGLVDAFTWIWKGLSVVGDAFKWIGDRFRDAWNYLSDNIFKVGQWLWSGIQGFANQVVNGANFIAVSINSFFIEIWNNIYDSVISYKSAIDAWWAGIMITIRGKMKQSIVFSVTSYVAWNSMTRIPQAKSLSDLLYGLGGILLAPIPAVLISEMIDVLVPIPSTTTFKITPDLGALKATPPTYAPVVPAPPSPEAIPTYPYTPVCDYTATIETTYVHGYMGGRDVETSIATEYELEVV